MFASALTGFNYFYPEKPKVLMGTGFANATWDSDAGYRAIQATRPYTLSFGLTDSPVGLMGKELYYMSFEYIEEDTNIWFIIAWILEKFHVWTYHEGSSDEADLPSTISYDEFLTNVMVYWMTNTISSSTRIYYEYFNLNEGKINTKKIGIPTAAAVFQNEIIKVPEDWLKPGADLRQYTNYSVVMLIGLYLYELYATVLTLFISKREDILPPWSNLLCWLMIFNDLVQSSN
jgi:hypothetical protein